MSSRFGAVLIACALALNWATLGPVAATARQRTASCHKQIVHAENDRGGGRVGAAIDTVTGTSCANAAKVFTAALRWFDYRKGALGTTEPSRV